MARAACLRALGPAAFEPLGTPGRTWRARGSRGRRALVKRPPTGRAFRQERDAHRAWLGALADVVPPLLASDERARVLVFAWSAGRPVEQLDLPRGLERAAHARAGDVLRRLQERTAPPADRLPLALALARRGSSWLARASGILSRDETRAAAHALDDVSCFEGERRVPCHRDFHQANWLATLAGGRLAALHVVDFEHARPDAAAVDLVRAWDGRWRERPDLRSAFFEGFGETPDGRRRRQVRLLTWLHALATVAWSAAHGDARHLEAGRDLVRRLVGERLPA